MKPETVLLLRKLAREATIFALLGMVLAGIGVFVVMDNADTTNAKRQAEIAVHAGFDLSAGIEPPAKPVPTVQVPLSNGSMLRVCACQPRIEPNTHSEGEHLANDKDFLAATQSDQVNYLSKIDSDFAKASSKDQLAYLAYITHKTGKDPQHTYEIIFDEIADQKKDCRRFSTDPLAIRISVPKGNADQVAIEKDYCTAYQEARHHALGGTLLGTLYISLLGFPAGLGLWIFYRLVRFAVKG